MSRRARRRTLAIGVASRCQVPHMLASIALGLLAALAFTAPAEAAAQPSLSVRAAALIDARTGQWLYGVEPNRELAIASTTKLMTALITLEHARLSRTFVAPDLYFPPADSQIGLRPGERMSVHDLLIALLLPSADDAAADLAYNVGRRSIARFVGMMNARARQLGLRHTHYSTPSGLDTPGNYSTAADLLKLAAFILRTQPFFARTVATSHAVLRTGSHVRSVSNRNDLVGKFPWIKGVKTGHTAQAGYVLVGLGERGALHLLSAVLGTSSEAARDANTLSLLDYGFSEFRIVRPVRRGEVLARPPVKDQPGKHAVVIAAAGFSRILPRSERVRIVLQLPRQLAGPLRQRTRVGTAVLRAGGRVIARIPLVLWRSIPAVSPLTRAARFVTQPGTLVLLVVVLGAALAMTVRRRLRTRRAGEEGAEPA
jgi:D-alanyl-D-alanine carboxypeptidase (penicillin-binding protein 5/6)